MCSTQTPAFTDNNALSNNLYNIPFLPGFSSSPGWLLVTRTRGAWWCRYRGHWRSGPRHLSPRSRVCAQEWHCEDLHSHIQSHSPMHTPKKKKKKKKKRQTLNSPNMTLSLSCPLPVQTGSGRPPGSLADAFTTAPRPRPSRLGQYWQKTFVDVFNTNSSIYRQQCPF